MDPTEQQNIIAELQKLELFDCYENNIPLRDHVQNIYVLNSLLSNSDMRLKEAAELYFSYGIEQANKIILDRRKFNSEQLENTKKCIVDYINQMREIGLYEKYIKFVEKCISCIIKQDTYNFIMRV